MRLARNIANASMRYFCKDKIKSIAVVLLNKFIFKKFTFR